MDARAAGDRFNGVLGFWGGQLQRSNLSYMERKDNGKLYNLTSFIAGTTSANESLFTYDEGKNHASYFDSGYKPVFLDEEDLVFKNATLGQQAQSVCGDSKQCLFDIYTTGKVSIGRASKQAMESYIVVINQTETTSKHINVTHFNEHKLLTKDLYFLPGGFFLSAVYFYFTLQLCETLRHVDMDLAAS